MEIDNTVEIIMKLDDRDHENITPNIYSGPFNCVAGQFAVDYRYNLHFVMSTSGTASKYGVMVVTSRH